MANTYTQLHIQFVCVVKYREALIHQDWKTNLFKYIAGIIQNKGHKLLAINGVEDHIHLFIGMRPTEAVSDFMKDIKQFSSKWINENKFVKRKFEWQEGFGAFSYSLDAVPNVVNYIHNQELHHSKTTFNDEYLAFLNEFKIDYNEKYLFKLPA